VLTPLETGELISNDKVGMRGSLPATEGAFLGVDGKGAEVETLKPAEDGRGYVMRLLETSGRAHSVSVASGLFQIDRVWETSAVEDDRREVALNNHAVAVDLPANGIVTLRLLLSYTPKPAAPVHAIGD